MDRLISVWTICWCFVILRLLDKKQSRLKSVDSLLRDNKFCFLHSFFHPFSFSLILSYSFFVSLFLLSLSFWYFSLSLFLSFSFFLFKCFKMYLQPFKSVKYIYFLPLLPSFIYAFISLYFLFQFNNFFFLFCFGVLLFLSFLFSSLLFFFLSLLFWSSIVLLFIYLYLLLFF